jgi:hypothetical protein
MEWLRLRGAGTKQPTLVVLEKLSMKKFTAMLLCLCFAVSILGCTEEKSTKKEEKSATTTKSTTPKD